MIERSRNLSITTKSYFSSPSTDYHRTFCRHIFRALFCAAGRHYGSPVGRLWGRALNVDCSLVFWLKNENVALLIPFHLF